MISDKVEEYALKLKDECVKEKLVSMVVLVNPDNQDNITFVQGHAVELLISMTATLHTIVEQSKGTITLDDAMELLHEMVDMVKDHTYHQFKDEGKK